MVEPVLPPCSERSPGPRPVSDRLCLEGVLFVLHTGIPWQQLSPELGFGSGQTCWRRLERWQEAGVFDGLHGILSSQLNAAGHHGVVGPLGVLIQASVTRIHVEWYDPISEDHMYAGRAQRLRYGVAYILSARNSGGSPVPTDPQPAAAPVAAPPVLPKPGDIARYCGSLADLRGQLVRVHYCRCDEDFCAGYRAEPLDSDLPGAVRVRRTSFAVEAA